MKNFIKLLSLSLWLIPLTFFNKLLMIPFFEDKMAFIALDSKYLIKMIDYTKLDIYLMILPSLAFMIAMIILINRACYNFKKEKSNVNNIILKAHIYLFILFLIMICLYLIGLFRLISPYFFGY